MQGIYAGGDSNQVRMDQNGTIRTFDIAQVQSVIFSETSYQPPPPPPRRPSRDNGNYQPPPPQTAGITIPVDTPVKIRMIDSVNSDTSRQGETFRAALDEPVYVDGQQAIPRGADVVIKLVEDQQSGKIEGRTVLTLALSTITVNGRPVDVTSTDVKTESSSRGQRSAGVIGGTAALGAIIGAIAGGGKGAAIGAGSGARGRNRRGSADQRPEGQDSFRNQTDLPVAESHSAMRIATAALVLMLAVGPRASAARNDVVEGNPASSVRVLIYDDLQCSECARFRVMMDQKILPRYGARVAFIHRDFPLGKHDWAGQAAVAARWVNEQSGELGIIIRREILAEQDAITSQNLKQWLVDFAYRNHLDPKGMAVASLTDQRLITVVDQDRQAAVARGVNRAPTVFVGGVPFAETIIFEEECPGRLTTRLRNERGGAGHRFL